MELSIRTADVVTVLIYLPAMVPCVITPDEIVLRGSDGANWDVGVITMGSNK